MRKDADVAVREAVIRKVTVQVGLRTLLRRIASPLGRKTVRMSKTGIAPSNLHAELAGSCNRSALG